MSVSTQLQTKSASRVSGITFLPAVTKVSPPQTPESIFMGVTFACGAAESQSSFLQCSVSLRFTPWWGSARSQKEAARQRNPCSLLMQRVLALSCTESVGRFKIQLALGRRNKRLKKKGSSRKSFVYHSRSCSPSSSLCYEGVCGELGVQPVGGTDHTDPVPAAHSPGHTPLHWLDASLWWYVQKCQEVYSMCEMQS